MVTMSDVAKAAGVSVMTVSNVINGHPYVSEETRGRVTEAVERLGYRVNVAARNLRAGSTGLIGLAVPGVGHPYHGELADRVVRAAGLRGYRVAVEETGATREAELSALSRSRLRMYDGLLISTVELGDEDVARFPADFPVVVLGERISVPAVDHVTMANFDGARDATRHLLERGCRRIAVVGGRLGEETDAPTLRTAGYRAALREAGVPADDALVVGCGFATEAGAAAARGLVDAGLVGGGAADPVDGLVCLTDSIAFGVLRGLADRGVAVPGEVLVIGFDDVSLAAYTVPSLSTVAPGHDEMVEAALSMLADRMGARRGAAGAAPKGPDRKGSTQKGPSQQAGRAAGALTGRRFVGPHRVVVRGSTTR